MVRGNMRGGRGGVRVGIRGNFQKKSTFSKFKCRQKIFHQKNIFYQISKCLN